MNPRMAGKAWESLEDAGDTTSQVGTFGLAVAQQVKRAQNDGILLGAQNGVDGDINAAHDALATWTDYTNADQLKQQTAEALKAKYSEKYGDKPQIWRHVEPYIGKELNQYNKAVDVRSVQLTTEYNKAQLIHSQLGAENDAANELTVEGKEKVWAKQDAITDLMVQNGSISADHAEIAKQQLRQRTIDTEVARASNPTNSPEVMQQELERLKTYAGKGYVDPEKLEQMQDHLSKAMEVSQNRADRVDVAKEGDGAIADYRQNPAFKDPETGRFDPGKAADAVSNDDSLSTKTKKYVREEFEQEDGARKKEDNDRDQKILDHEDAGVESGKTTHAQIVARQNLDPSDPQYLPRRVADHLLTKAAQIQRQNRIENMQERSMMRQESREKSSDLARELLGQDGFIADKNELTPYILKGLSKADAATVWSMKSLQGSKDYGDALKLINSSSIYPQTDEGNVQKMNDIQKLRETVESQKLTGSAITEAAEKMIKPKQEAQAHSQVKALLDNMWGNFKSNVGLGSTPATGPQVGDVVQGYKFKGGDPADQKNWDKQ